MDQEYYANVIYGISLPRNLVEFVGEEKDDWDNEDTTLIDLLDEFAKKNGLALQICEDDDYEVYGIVVGIKNNSARDLSRPTIESYELEELERLKNEFDLKFNTKVKKEFIDILMKTKEDFNETELKPKFHVLAYYFQ